MEHVNNPAANDLIDQLVDQRFADMAEPEPEGEDQALINQLVEEHGGWEAYDDRDGDGEEENPNGIPLGVEDQRIIDAMGHEDDEEENEMPPELEAEYQAHVAEVLAARAAAEAEEGCCICLNPPEDIDEWVVLTCGANGHNLHRVCKGCYITLEANGKEYQGRNVEAFERGMRVVECPICRHLQAPTLNNYRDLSKELHRNRAELRRLRGIDQGRARDLQNEVDRTRVELNRLRRNARPPAPQAAGGGGGHNRSVERIFTIQDFDNRHRAEASRHVRDSMIGNLHEVQASAEVDVYHHIRLEVHAAHQLVLQEEGNIAAHRRHIEAIALQPAAVREPDEGQRQQLAAAEVRLEAKEEAYDEAINQYAQQTDRLTQDQKAYVRLFMPNYDDIEIRQRTIQREEQAARVAVAAQQEQRNRDRLANLQVIQNANADNRRQRLIQNIADRRDNMHPAAWVRQRETCWCKLNGQPCDTAQKTCRFCSVAGCENKVCRRCDTCGNH